MTVIRQVFCGRRKRALPTGLLALLKELLFWNPRAVGQEDPTRADTGLSQLFELAEAEFDWNNEIANNLQTQEVLHDLIREFGHTFGRHNIAPAHKATEWMEAQVLPKLVEEEETELDVRLALTRLHALMTLMKAKIDAVGVVAEQLRGSRRRATLGYTAHDLFETLAAMPGHVFIQEFQGSAKLNYPSRVEQAYWRRVKLSA